MKFLRRLLYPFSLLYGGITMLRNYLYDSGRWESRTYSIPVICVGNLSVGGTGKSPMIEYLIAFLKEHYELAILSRGYKRKTQGYVEATEHSTVDEIGDEPLQIKQNFPNVTVAVCADRRKGISLLEKNADVILLDDAFQHRKVKATLNILLTPFNDLYIDDVLMPAGNLREPKSGAARADIIIVTKCPDKVSYAKLQEIQFRLQLQPGQKLYFSKIGYHTMIYGKTESLPLNYLLDKPFTLVTGIANPEPLVSFLEQNNYTFTHQEFPDHHDFSPSEIKKLEQSEIVLTTEKDYMRLQPKMKKFALYYLPIKTIILNEQEGFFKEAILSAVRKKQRG